MTGFCGAKVAILYNGHVLSILRDDDARIPFPGQWDLPGGGREDGETPVECVIRETAEELSLHLSPTDITWQKRYTGTPPASGISWFLVARPPVLDPAHIRLGNEGQMWRSLTIADFMSLENAVPHLKLRLADYLGRTDRALVTPVPAS
ncbi:NUDIX hydrolase [Tropicimonas sp.]|uniref:NUDIX hydrolase n=1 Tax=Tropicimonas sp. TaxID=2067044 RepID=UPI003A86F7C7